MKIVQIVTQMEAGGAQKVASLLTEGLRKRGHDAQLWFLYEKRAAYEKSGSLRVFRSHKPNPAQMVKLGAQLWREFLRQKPDVVITHTHSANAFAAPIAATTGVPVKIAVHHNPIETYATSMRRADRLAFRSGCYSEMVAVSGGVMHSFDQYEPDYRKHLHRIYNGVSCSPADASMTVRNRYGIPGHLRLLVNVGRLAAQKNQKLLLQMLQHIPDAFLLLVGEGELRSALVAEAECLGVAGRVCFTGELPPAQVSAILQQSDLFLLPSLYESFCLAAVEAMNCGLPVVASYSTCLREVLGEGQMFFPLNNLEDLVRAVRYLLDHSGQREAMSAAGVMQAERFSVPRMVGEYECLLAEALLYAPKRRSAAHNFRRFDALGSVSRIHHQL